MTSPSTAPPATATVSLCRDAVGFAALEGAWNELHERCGTATPFQTHAWLRSWWCAYGRPGRLRVILVRRGEELIGAAPLMLTYRPLPTLVPLGGPISDFSDVLLADEHGEEAVPALLRGLRQAGRRHVIDLREVRPDASAHRLYEDWPGARRRLDDSTCLELPAAPVHELVRRLASSRAQRVRAKLRKLDAAGIDVRTVAEHDVPQAVHTLLQLHTMQWQGRGITREHLTPRFARHLTQAVQGMVRTGAATVTLYRLEGRTMAANLTLHSGPLSGGYLYGADPALRRRKLDVIAILLRADAEQAVSERRAVISLLRGDEPYKHHWRPDRIVNQRLLLAPTGLSALLELYCAHLAARRSLARKASPQLARVRAAWQRTRVAVTQRGNEARPYR